MSEISINTTQNVNLNFTAANIGHRLAAYLLDLLIKFSYMFFINWAIISNMGLGEFNIDNWSVTAIYIIFYSPAMVYTLVLESLMEGQTIGKKIMSIKVVKIDGYQASFMDYLIRWVCRLIDMSGTMYLVGVSSMSISKIHQRIGDMAAGTAVITLKNDINISHTILENIATDYKPSYEQVIKFSDNDMRIIKETFINARKVHDYVLIRKLVDKIEEVSGIKCEGNEAVFISKVIRDYNYYTGE
ncbi:MAG: RDD family protein [Saprospiraceae bacterium]|nr:RDD family protein [Saprospiraceae bacterium]